MAKEVVEDSAKFWARAIALWKRLARLSLRAPRRLRLCESLPLGERRFVAVVEVDDASFLVGGTSSSLVLLSRLGEARDQAEGEQETLPWKARAIRTRRGRIEEC
jgi:flagellar biogenesis protein FliO